MVWEAILMNEMVQLSCRIPRSLWREVRLNAVQQEVTLSEWVSNALRVYLDASKGRPEGPEVELGGRG
jgi:hypothetical protein